MRLHNAALLFSLLSPGRGALAADARGCGTAALKQADYRGTIAQTENGRTCQSWASQSPHRHSRKPVSYPNGGLDGNACRNPDASARAWCYTQDPGVRWEWCAVPNCEDYEPPTPGDVEEDRARIYGDGAPLDGYLEVGVYGSTVRVADVEVPYDQNQNHVGKASPAFVNHTAIDAVGNTWSAYLLPEEVEIRRDTVLQFSFDLRNDTVEGFQAVCLDADTEETGANGQCFALRSTQGWISKMVNVPTQTGVGERTFHSIPVGDFLTGPVNYLAFLQDSDGPDRGVGRSSLEDIRLVNLYDEHLEIEINGQLEYLDNNQLSYQNGGATEDTVDYWMHISEDRKSVQINGNQWKALPLNAPYGVTASTVLEFDITVDQSVDFHAVCLDADLSRTEVEGSSECVILMNPLNSVSSFHHLTTKLEVEVPQRIVVPFGNFLQLRDGETFEVNYLGFVQDNDESERHEGRSTWTNFRLYEQERNPVMVHAFGAPVAVPNVQLALDNEEGEHEDSLDHILSVSGTEITATGNSWKYLELPEPLMVSEATVLKFNFTLYEEAERHGICLLAVAYVQDERKDCFFTAGTDEPDSDMGVDLMYTEEGGALTYEVIVGSYFTGEVKYLGLVLDNDADRTIGQSTWSNIEIYDLPSLNIALDKNILAVDNNQMSYRSPNHDSTPIRDHMATISEDGSSINMVGNMWRALKLPSPLTPSSLGDFVVSFDFTVTEAAEFHAICFEEDLFFNEADDPSDDNPRRCVATAYFQEPSEVSDLIYPDFVAGVGESHRYILNLSRLFHRLDYAASDPAPALPVLGPDVGNNGRPSDRFPLQACEADCDDDSECAPGLHCFQRSSFKQVPGCDGFGPTRTSDFCYDPTYNFVPGVINYVAFVSANDADRSVGNSTYSNVAIATSLTSCLGDEEFRFTLSDCTAANFLDEVQAAMEAKDACTGTDALLEMFAILDATQETDVYEYIEKVCDSAYKHHQFDFSDDTLAVDEALERQLVKEYIDGGTVMNYEEEAASTRVIGKVNEKYASSKIFSMPKHHALDNCDVGAAMCCFVAARSDPAPSGNSDVCYVDMKASQHTAHVRDGWSIYDNSADDEVRCEGFAWGTGEGHLASALRGNALFRAGFLGNFASGRVEQVPGAPLCGCVDRMPVVTEAACVDVKAPGSVVDISFDASIGVFNAALTLGDVEYGDCGGSNLADHYETLVGEGLAGATDAAYVRERIVGEGGCKNAIDKFLSQKGLAMS